MLLILPIYFNNIKINIFNIIFKIKIKEMEDTEDMKIKVFYNNQAHSFNKKNDFNIFKQDCFRKFGIINEENILFYIKLNDIIIEINDQYVYKDNILIEINTPVIYISNKDLFNVKKQIKKVNEEIITIKDRIKKYQQIINKCKENIYKNEQLLEDYKKIVNERVKKFNEEIENLEKTKTLSNPSSIFSKNEYLSLLHNINLNIINLNIPEINRNKIEEYYIIKIKIENKGPIPIPDHTCLSIIDRKSPFKTQDNEYINNANKIETGQTIDIMFKLYLRNKDLLNEGINVVNLSLFHRNYAQFGDSFQIKIAYS